MAERIQWWTERWLRSPLFLSLSLSLTIYLSVCLSFCLSIYLSICLSVYLFICKLKNEAILRDLLNFCTWQHQKRSTSARFPICFKVHNIKNEAILRDVLQNGKLSAELTASYHCVLWFFQSICLNYCACHEKVMPGHTKCCTCHAKSSQQTWRSDAPKCNPSQEISARTS